MTSDSPWLETGHDARDELVVVIHGFSRAGARMAAVRETMRVSRPAADIFTPPMPYGENQLCERKAEDIVADVVRQIDGLVEARRRAGGEYKTITLIGHSFGAVLARKLAIVANGERFDKSGHRPAPFEPELAEFRAGRAWAPLIKRIVLLAGMNRGWSVSSAMDWLTTVWWGLLQLVGELVLGGRPTIFAIRRGAPFLVQTRLQWIALMDPHCGPKPEIIVVQLLGTVDDQVAPDDNVDYSVDLYGSGQHQSYFYLEVGQSNHPNVIEMSEKGPAGTQAARDERRGKFLLALNADPEELARRCITREQMADNLPPRPDPSVHDLVFVVHGIRDKGFWTQKIARNIKRHAPAGRKIESWTRSYGYFAMLPFMLRTVRQRKVEWLMDCFAEARARYPRAEFHYVGHSNGTYLAAKALTDYPAARFKHIVFAGSVVRCDYDWLGLMQPRHDTLLTRDGKTVELRDHPRVSKVLNYVATRDWVVALFPKALQVWPIFNLGSAGHDGFRQASENGPVYQVNYVVGSHSAGHEEPNWDDIARFIVRGDPPTLRYPPFGRKQSLLWRILGKLSFILFPVLVLLILAIGVWIVLPFLLSGACWAVSLVSPPSWAFCKIGMSAAEAATRVLSFFLYLWLVYLAVTRF